MHARKLKSLAPDVDLLQLARDLPGVSGADLENILNESALNAVRREGSEVNVHDVYDAVDRILQVRITIICALVQASGINCYWDFCMVLYL